MTAQLRRKLTTILAADAAGFSSAMSADEVGAYDSLHRARAVFEKLIEAHSGRIANTAGDGLIAEFPSVVEAVQCAVEAQNELSARHAPSGHELQFRIGIHLGDVIVDGDDLIGEGVNLAARLESMAEPGGVLISQQVYDQVRNKLAVGFEYEGERRPKNFPEDVPVYRVAVDRSEGGVYDIFRPSGPPRRAEPPRRPDHLPSGDERRRMLRLGATAAALVALFLVGDLFRSPGLDWAYWPALGLATAWGLRAAPAFVKDPRAVPLVRGGVIIAALTAINLITTSDHIWVFWPAGAILAVAMLRSLFSKPPHDAR